MGFLDILRDKTFYVLLFSGFFAFTGRTYMQSGYKLYGSSCGIDDNFLSFTGSVAMVTGGFGRILWAWLIDLYGFKRISVLVYSAVSLLFVTLPLISDYKYVYLIWVALLFLGNGSTQPMFGAVCGTIWGPATGGKVFGLVVGMMGISGLIIGILQGVLISKIGYINMLMILVVATVICVLMILLLFTPRRYEESVESPLLKEETADFQSSESTFSRSKSDSTDQSSL